MSPGSSTHSRSGSNSVSTGSSTSGRRCSCSSGLLAILGLFCIPVLWKGERELGIKLVGAWIGINLLGGIVMMWMISKIGFYPQFDFGPEAGGTEISEAINTFSAIVTGAQIVICNGILLAILVLVANKSKPETSFDIPSGFRPTEPPQS